MNVQQLHKQLGDLIDAGLGRATVLTARDPEGNGTPQVTNHIETGHWAPRHDTFTEHAEMSGRQKTNAVVIWPR